MKRSVAWDQKATECKQWQLNVNNRDPKPLSALINPIYLFVIAAILAPYDTRQDKTRKLTLMSSIHKLIRTDQSALRSVQ